MGGCIDKPKQVWKFKANITADLKTLYSDYLKVIVFLRDSNFFKEASGELNALCQEYL
jgi:hypothetical protein